MDGREQADFERRQREAGMKTEYSLRNSEGFSYTVNKTMYDYALWRRDPKQAVPLNKQVTASTPAPTPAPARAVEPPTPAPADVPPGESIVPGAVADNVPAKSTLPPDQETAIRAEIQKLEAEIAKWRDKMELATKEENPTRIKVIEQQLVIPQRQLEAEYGKLSGTHRHVPAPPNMDLSTRAALSKEQIQYAVVQLRKIADDMESGAIKTATIEIPGDGLVTVYNAAMARGAAERISKGVPSVPSVTKSLTFGDAPRFPKRSKAEVAQDFAETEHTVSFGNAYAPLGDVKSNIKKGWQGLIDESPWGISDGYMMLRRDKVQPKKSAMFAKMDDRGKGKNTLVKKSKIEDYVSELGKAEQSGQTRVAEFGGVDLNQAEEQIAYYIVDNEVHSFSANRVRIIDQLYEPDVVKINSRDHAIFYKDGELVAALSPFVVKNLPTVDDLRGAMGGDAPNMRTYEFTVPTPEEMLGFQKGESVYDNLRNWIARLRKVGNNTAPQMAEVAQANIRGLNDLEATLLREMPGLLQGAPNELNGFQKLAVLDEVRQWLPQYDNALAQAQEVGNSMVNWIMLNYSDRRNFDTILQMIGIPYHYFWSRMPSRLAMAALTKPELVNFYYEATRAIGLENEQADVPQRLEGTLPGPGNSRVQVKRTLDYAIPGMSYFQPNPFAGEPLDEGELAQWANTWEKWAPGFGPLGSLMIDLASNGQLDGNYGAVLNDLMPIPPSSIYQMATGNMPQQGAPIMGVPTGFGPNEFDPDRARRAIASIGVEEELGDVLTGYANQVVLNQYNGVPIGTDIPPEMLQAAIDLANRGVRRAAEDRLAGRGSAWATGASVQPYPQSEQEMRQTRDAYFAAGYDPTLNPDGSKALQNAVLDETELPTWWTKNDETPGIDAQLSDLYDEQRRLREEKIEAEQAAVNALDLGSASKEEIYNARTEAGAPYQAQIDANDQRIEQLQGQQTPDTMPNNPNQGMNPAEISTRYVTDVLYDAGRLPGRPEWPGDNASSQAKREYYEAQRRYEAAQQAYVVNALADPVMSTSDQVREMRGPAQYTEEKAVEVWKNWRNRNKTDGEIQRVAALDAITEANRVQWENRKADVYTTFGDDVGTLYEQYLNLPEGDARAQFKAQNPELRAVGLYTWNPEQYAYLAQTYSPEAIMVWARTPAWEDSEEGRARRSAYYDLHPEAFEINAWLYGRPGSAGEQDITDDDTFSYNFGTDYDQAKQLFGDNIWSVVGGYKRGWDKQTKSAYFDANPQLSGFFDWWYAKLPSSSTASRNEFKTSGYGQRYGTYGGGWSGGGWSGSSSSWGGRDDPAYVRPEQFDQRLMPQLGQLRRWEPTRNNTNWINEGRALEYRRRGKWEPPAFGRTRVL